VCTVYCILYTIYYILYYTLTPPTYLLPLTHPPPKHPPPTIVRRGYYSAGGNRTTRSTQVCIYTYNNRHNNKHNYTPYTPYTGKLTSISNNAYIFDTYTQEPCQSGAYCTQGVVSSCPAGRYGLGARLTDPLCTGACSKGHYCPAGSESSTAKPCPIGM
jgi:hypothetical protein